MTDPLHGNVALVVADEWVIGDDGRDLHVGEKTEFSVYPLDEDEEAYLLKTFDRIAALMRLRTDAPIYVWHPEGPDPPACFCCVVRRIWSVGHHSDDRLATRMISEVESATTDPTTAEYFFLVDVAAEPKWPMSRGGGATPYYRSGSVLRP